MQTNHDDDFYSPSRRETIATLLISGLTLAVLIGAGYLAPNLLALLAR
ncbi:hypothetical protein N7402_00775 [Pseudomonas aeruginosa]|nr:hypothetical protein [Pseudomonas aeruginosa]MDH0373915.1 hypothetical protein [Pseudomonas aeruginosa]